MLQLTYMGEDFEFTHCKWETKETGKRFVWHILGRNQRAVVKVSGSCSKAEMLALRYEAPDGQLLPFPLLAGAGGLGNVQLYRKNAGERELTDTLTLEHALCIYGGNGRPSDLATFN